MKNLIFKNFDKGQIFGMNGLGVFVNKTLQITYEHYFIKFAEPPVVRKYKSLTVIQKQLVLDRFSSDVDYLDKKNIIYKLIVNENQYPYIEIKEMNINLYNQYKMED